MKKYLLFLCTFLIMASVLTLVSCDDEEQIFDAPTIAVVSDVAEPYPGDKVKFTITVAAPGGLASVKLNGNVIKTYTAAEVQDNFEHEYTVPANATLGPMMVQFEVTDTQSTPKSTPFSSSLTILNPDFRGNPVVLYDFQGTLPNAKVKAITHDQGANSWENAYSLVFDVADPANATNKVLQVERKGAHEWYFQGGGAVFVELTNPMTEDDAEKLVSGERVLQLNMYFKEVPKLMDAHKDPTSDATVAATRQANVNFSWLYSYTNDPKVTGVPKVWDFNRQDSVQGGIPVIIEVGNKAQWDWNNGFVQGKKFFLAGSIQQKNGWQTVTFSRRSGTIAAQNNQWVFTNFRVATQQSTAPAALQDPDVGLDQINYMAIIINSRLTGFSNGLLNTEPWYEIPGDGNGWRRNQIVNISDDHNIYYLDNLRVIDAVDYDKNPNF